MNQNTILSEHPPAATPPGVTVVGNKVFVDNKSFEIHAEMAPAKLWAADVPALLEGLHPQTNTLVTQHPVSRQVLDILDRNGIKVIAGFREDRARGMTDISNGYYLCWLDAFAGHPAVIGCALDTRNFGADAFEKYAAYVRELYEKHPSLRRLPVMALYYGVPSDELSVGTSAVDGIVLGLETDQVTEPQNLGDIGKPVLVVRVDGHKPNVARENTGHSSEAGMTDSGTEIQGLTPLLRDKQLTGSDKRIVRESYASNVVKIIGDKDKAVPQYEETKYNAKLKAYNYDAVIAGAGFAQPIDGNIGEFLIENVKLTMKEGKFKNGAIETEELGKVRILFSSSVTSEGFIALFTDEQLAQLDKLVGQESKKNAVVAEEAWNAVDQMDVPKLNDFLKEFPNSSHANEAKFDLSLHQRIADFELGKTRSALVIPFEKLGERWRYWCKAKPSRGAVGVFRTESSAGVFRALGCATISTDYSGIPMTPTGDGSILAIQTNGLRYNYIGDIVFESEKGGTLYFAVVKDRGLVHIHGKGKVTIPGEKETSVDALAYGATFREGVFEVNLSSSFARASASKLSELRRTMMVGVRELAEASKLADPRDISQKGLAFLSAFQNQNGKLLLVFMGMQSPVVMDRDEMSKTNSERIKWGIESGHLRKTSRGVSKLSVDGIPCLLQDIENQGGGRMQTYLFFIPEAPRATFQFAIICDDLATYDAHAQDIEAIIASVKIVRKSP